MSAMLFLLATPVLAVDPEDETPPPQTNTSTVCKEGQVWDPKAKKCMPPRQSSLDGAQKFMAARELAYAGQLDRALAVLMSVPDQDSARVLTYRGFIARKRGQRSAALAFYESALGKDPDYLPARSYLGQWHIEDGNLMKAREQLAEIRRRGGGLTWPGHALKQAIRGVGGYSS